MRLAHSGFTLVEVMVSVFVLALGVIGAAGMQLSALRTTQQSGLQTNAVQLASEIAETMRANSSQMRLTGDDNPFIGIDYQAGAGDPPAPDASCFSRSSDCDAAQLASFEIHEWESRIRASLPSGRAVVCRDADPWDAGTHSYKWDCGASSPDAGSVVVKIGWQGKNPDGSLIRGTGTAQEFPPLVVLTVQPYVR
jgi:type IV pilus assembly protein PilV